MCENNYNKMLTYCRGTVQCTMSVEILSIVAHNCMKNHTVKGVQYVPVPEGHSGSSELPILER